MAVAQGRFLGDLGKRSAGRQRGAVLSQKSLMAAQRAGHLMYLAHGVAANSAGVLPTRDLRQPKRDGTLAQKRFRH